MTTIGAVVIASAVLTFAELWIAWHRGYRAGHRAGRNAGRHDAVMARSAARLDEVTARQRAHLAAIYRPRVSGLELACFGAWVAGAAVAIRRVLR